MLSRFYSALSFSVLFIFTLIFSSSPTLATPSPSLTAEGAILLEPKTNTVLYSKNGQAQFYPASTTKVLTTLILAESFDASLVFTKTADSVNTVPSDSSHIGLNIGDTYSFEAGLHGILMGSDNFISHDMALVHAESIEDFAVLMNERAKALGATSSHFVNPHGYHDADHYSTPYDLALITKAAFDNPLVTRIAGTPTYTFDKLNNNQSLSLKHTAAFFNKQSSYYNPSIVAAKTGFHTPAGRTLVAKAKQGDLELIAVVMKSEYPDFFEDINKLFEYGFSNFELLTSAEDTPLLNNISYSEWAFPYIERMYARKVFVPSTASFMDSTSGAHFLSMLFKSVPRAFVHSPLAQYTRLSTAPYKLNTDLTISTAQSLFESLATSLGIQVSPSFVSDALASYVTDANASLTLEQSIYLVHEFALYYYTHPRLYKAPLYAS